MKIIKREDLLVTLTWKNRTLKEILNKLLFQQYLNRYYSMLLSRCYFHSSLDSIQFLVRIAHICFMVGVGKTKKMCLCTKRLKVSNIILLFRTWWLLICAFLQFLFCSCLLFWSSVVLMSIFSLNLTYVFWNSAWPKFLVLYLFGLCVSRSSIHVLCETAIAVWGHACNLKI